MFSLYYCILLCVSTFKMKKEGKEDNLFLLFGLRLVTIFEIFPMEEISLLNYCLVDILYQRECRVYTVNVILSNQAPK